MLYEAPFSNTKQVRFMETVVWKHFYQKAKGYDNENSKKIQQQVTGNDQGRKRSDKEVQKKRPSNVDAALSATRNFGEIEEGARSYKRLQTLIAEGRECGIFHKDDIAGRYHGIDEGKLS